MKTGDPPSSNQPQTADMSDIELLGPFGNPDGARADLAEVLDDFVDFDGNPAFGDLATRADDAKVRVVAGKLGAGKTVHLRRLQEFQGRQESVYADVPQQGLPTTEAIVKVAFFRRANFRKRYHADGGHACTGSSAR